MHTLVLAGAVPLRLSDLASVPSLQCLSLSFCAGLQAAALPQLTRVRCRIYMAVPSAHQHVLWDAGMQIVSALCMR